MASQRLLVSATAVLAGDGRLSLGERLEDSGLGVLRNADAGVADFDAHPVFTGAGVPMVSQTHIDAPETGELEGVGQQVADDLTHPGRIAGDHGREVRRDQAGQLHAGRCVLRQQIGGVLDQHPKVERNALDLQVTGIELGHVENIVEQLDQHLA